MGGLDDYLKPILSLVLAAILVVVAPLFILYLVMLLNFGVYSWMPIGGYVIIIAWFYLRAQRQAAKKHDELHKNSLLEPIDQRVKEYNRLIKENDE